MRIKNVGTVTLNISRVIYDAQLNELRDIELDAGAEVNIFDEVAERSEALLALMNAGLIQKVAETEPNDSGVVADPASKLVNWALLNDLYVQFDGGNEGKNGISTTNTYDGVHGTALVVPLAVTNGLSVTDILNDVSTVAVSIASATAPGAKINTVAGPVTLTFAAGVASVSITATGAGDVVLHLASATHPSVSLLADIDATITLA